MTQGLRRAAAMVAVAGAAAFCSAPLTGAGAAAAGTHGAAGARAAASGGTWGTAEEVPGIGALNKGGFARISSVSCGSAGNCSAGGIYEDSSSHGQAFVVSERNGTWGTALEVPGTAALNTGLAAPVNSVSCASAGNCSAGGSYERGIANPVMHAFVVSERNGTWGTALEVPGTVVQFGFPEITSVSCGSAGNCSAAGDYSDNSGQQVFVVGERNGTWGTAKEVPGTAALNHGGDAEITSVSCASAGNCSAGGQYADAPGHAQAFVVGERNGTWGTAKEVPGTAVLNRGGVAGISSVSCASAGNCSASGFYKDRSGRFQVFVVGERNGTWGTAIRFPGIVALNQGGFARIDSVSCGSAGNCSAGGSYTNGSGFGQAFVVGERNGTWGTAIKVPGAAALGKGAGITSVSCGSAGNCSAGGSYGSAFGHALVVSETDGTWGTALEVPGTAALNHGDAATTSVSCASAGNCSAGGFYTDRSGHRQVFVVGETNGP
jgi:cytochrome c551/c552